MKNLTRCFVSLELPNTFITEIIGIQKQLEEKNLFSGKYTDKENIHLTLKFLGEISDEIIEKVKEKLKQIEFNKFSISFGEVGVFNPNHIRIIWFHLVGAEELQKKIDEALKDLFPKEKRFMSHLTIARVKNVENREKLIKELKQIKVLKIESEISKFFLKKSILTPKGPIYNTIEEIYSHLPEQK